MEPQGHFPRHPQPYPPHHRQQQQQQRHPHPQQPYPPQHHQQQFPQQPFPQPPFQHPHHQQYQQQHAPQHYQQHHQTLAQGPVIPEDPVYAALEAFALEHGELGPADVSVLKGLLEQLMRDCSQANIQAGKSWIVHHCQNPPQYDNLARALVAVTIAQTTFGDKLHIIYLVNDILSHSERSQQRWIKDAFLQHLVPLLRVAYFVPGIEDPQRQRVMKVLGIWRSAEYFPPHVIAAMELDVKRPPTLPGPSVSGTGPPHPYQQHPSGVPINAVPFTQGHQPAQLPHNSHGLPSALQQLPQYSFPRQQGQHAPPAPPHHQTRPQLQDQNVHPQAPIPVPSPAPTHRDAYTKELPAAIMVSKIEIDSNYYEPLPAKVSVALQPVDISMAIIASVDDFLQEIMTCSEPADEGWHSGLLDEYFKKSSERRKQIDSLRKPESRGDDSRQRSRSRRRDDRTGQPSRSQSKSRSRSLSYSSRSRSRSRSDSPPYRRRGSRSHSKDPGQRRSSRSKSRSRSRSRGRSRGRPLRRGRSRSRSVTPPPYPLRRAGLGSHPAVSSVHHPSFS